MNDEDDFQRMLDANPADHTTRLVFADWLQERDDPRAEGYRAMGRRQLCPQSVVMNAGIQDARHDTQWVYGRRDDPFATDPDYGRGVSRACLLPYVWFEALPYTDRVYSFNVDKEQRSWEHFPSRREAEDALAMAFAKLKPRRRASLLRIPGERGAA